MAHDLRIGGLTMWLRKLFGGRSSPVRDATSSAASASEQASARRIADFLVKMLESHGVACGRHEDWLTSRGELPAIRGVWTPHEHSGRLDIQVLVEPEVLITESFAGMAAVATRTHLDDALRNFTINSFHVLLSALWSQDDPEQVLTETWQIGDAAFTAFIGNVGTRATDVPAPPLPQALLPTLERAIRSEPLSPRLHWFRFYFGTVRGEPIFEALRDNETWDAGLDALKSVAWEPSDHFYSARLFLILRPVAS